LGIHFHFTSGSNGQVRKLSRNYLWSRVAD